MDLLLIQISSTIIRRLTITFISFFNIIEGSEDEKGFDKTFCLTELDDVEYTQDSLLIFLSIVYSFLSLPCVKTMISPRRPTLAA